MFIGMLYEFLIIIVLVIEEYKGTLVKFDLYRNILIKFVHFNYK